MRGVDDIEVGEPGALGRHAFGIVPELARELLVAAVRARGEHRRPARAVRLAGGQGRDRAVFQEERVIEDREGIGFGVNDTVGQWKALSLSSAFRGAHACSMR